MLYKIYTIMIFSAKLSLIQLDCVKSMNFIALALVSPVYHLTSCVTQSLTVTVDLMKRTVQVRSTLMPK